MTDKLIYVASAPFNAARQLAGLGESHELARMHGHSFEARVHCGLGQGFADVPGTEPEALRALLDEEVAALDFRVLNEIIDEPTDSAIAAWIAGRLAGTTRPAVGVRSARTSGVERDDDGQAFVWRKFRFEAAHRLPNVPLGHKCGRMHGHGFDVVLHSRSDGNADIATGDELTRAWRPLYEILHLGCLNDIDGLENPTSEMLARWIWDRLEEQLPGLAWVTVSETKTTGCHFDGETFQIWKERHFESALRLLHAPDGDRRRRLHGHSYRLRLHLRAGIDDVMGWVTDYADIKAALAPSYQLLDHRELDQVEGIGADASAAAITQWLRDRLEPGLPYLARIDLFEAPGCGVIRSLAGSGEGSRHASVIVPG